MYKKVLNRLELTSNVPAFPVTDILIIVDGAGSGFYFKNTLQVCASEGIFVSILRFYTEVPGDIITCLTSVTLFFSFPRWNYLIHE